MRKPMFTEEEEKFLCQDWLNRKLLGLTQEDLAECAGCSRKTLYRIFKKHGIPARFRRPDNKPRRVRLPKMGPPPTPAEIQQAKDALNAIADPAFTDEVMQTAEESYWDALRAEGKEQLSLLGWVEKQVAEIEVQNSVLRQAMIEIDMGQAELKTLASRAKTRQVLSDWLMDHSVLPSSNTRQVLEEIEEDDLQTVHAEPPAPASLVSLGDLIKEEQARRRERLIKELAWLDPVERLEILTATFQQESRHHG